MFYIKNNHSNVFNLLLLYTLCNTCIPENSTFFCPTKIERKLEPESQVTAQVCGLVRPLMDIFHITRAFLFWGVFCAVVFF